MADTFIKRPVLYKGTKAQIESATMGENDFAVATDVEFYTKEEVDSAIADASGGGLESVTHDASLTGAGTADSPLAIAPTVTAQINSKADQTVVDVLNGEVSDLMADVSAVEADVMGKVAIAQGAENAGKILKVDDNGNVIVGEGGGASLSILSYMWADHLLNDPSWVHSGSFVWQSGDYYVAAYEHLYNEIVHPMYCWGNVYYSYTETPSVGDTIYYRGDGSYTTVEEVGDGYIVVKDTRNGLSVTIDRDASNDSTSIAIGMGRKTETTGNVTITYYQADDGHKICTADQETNLMALYSSTGLAWYFILDTDNRRFKLPRKSPSLMLPLNKTAIVGTTSSETLTTDTIGRAMTMRVMTTGDKPTTNTILGITSGGTGVTGWANNNNDSLGVAYAPTNLVARSTNSISSDDSNKNLYFYVGNFEKESIEQTAGITSEILNAKADIVSVANLALPSNNFIDIALPASGGSYYAPADGFVYVQKKSTSNSTAYQYLNLYNRTAANLSNTMNTETGAAVINAWVPARKGNRIEFQYNLGGDTVLCRFIYAQGAQ